MIPFFAGTVITKKRRLQFYCGEKLEVERSFLQIFSVCKKHRKQSSGAKACGIKIRIFVPVVLLSSIGDFCLCGCWSGGAWMHLGMLFDEFLLAVACRLGLVPVLWVFGTPTANHGRRWEMVTINNISI